MDSIYDFLNVNFRSVFISVIIILIAVKTCLTLFEWFVSKTGLETKWIRRKREDHELLVKTSESLIALKEKQAHDVEQSIIHDKRINDKLEELTKMFIDKQIDDMRYEILDFASGLSRGQRYSKEQFDHVINIYSKYEIILKNNNLTNGHVTASMEVINDVYKNKLMNGF